MSNNTASASTTPLINFNEANASFETEKMGYEEGKKTAFYINATYVDGFVPKFHASVRKSDAIEGEFVHEFLTRIQETGKVEHLTLTVTDVNLDAKYRQVEQAPIDPVLDAELNKLLEIGTKGVGLVAAKDGKDKKKEVQSFCYINMELSSIYLDGVLKTSVKVPIDAPKVFLAKMLAASKCDVLDLPVTVTSVCNPATKKVVKAARPIDF